MSDAGRQVAGVVAVSSDGAARVGDGVDCVVSIVGPDGGRAGALLRQVLGLQPAVTIVRKAGVLISAATFPARIRANLRDLIAHVV